MAKRETKNGTRKRRAQQAAGKPPLDVRDPCRLAHMTWEEAAQRLGETDVALLPVGSTEQHGPHLPLDVDTWDAEHLALAVAERVRPPKPLVLPVVPYGVAYHHAEFAGTISVGPDTLSRVVYDVGVSLARQGVRKLVIVNGHGGNIPALNFTVQLLNRDAKMLVVVDTGESSDSEIAELVETRRDIHAGEYETSTMLATRPELVRMDRARASIPRFPSKYLDFSCRESVDLHVNTRKLSRTGVLGDPTKATREKGERMWEIMVRNLTELVEDLKKVDPATLRRYE